MKLKLKIFTLTLLLSFFFQNSYSQQNMNGWFWVNGQPQTNSVNKVKILDATNYYSVGNNGTFMKSNDGGDTWLINSQAGVTDLSFGSGGTYSLYSLWFFNANTGIVAGQSAYNEEAFIRKTTDAGVTFNSIGLGVGSGSATSSKVNDIYFINSSTGFICGSKSVKGMKTTNGGTSWTVLPNLPAANYSYSAVYALDANNIYLGTESQGLNRIIIRTTDGGANWTEQTLPGSTPVTFKDILFRNSNTGYACGAGSGSNIAYFAYTTNAGVSWTQSVFPSNSYPLNDIEISGSTVYTLSSFNSYYYSSNLGVTWDSVNYSDPTNPYQPIVSSFNAFSINGSDIIVAGLYGKINISNDGGSSWRNKNYAVDYVNYCFSSTYAMPGTQKVWAGAYGGGQILYSTNRGTNWTLIQTSASESFEDIEMTDANTGYAAGGNINFGGYCYKTTNGGATFLPTAALPTPTIKSNGISFVNNNTGWVFSGSPFGNTNQISKTTNGGATWVGQSFSPSHNLAFNDGDMANVNTGYCVGAKAYKTTNGGFNWNQITTLPQSLNWNRVKTFSPSTFYLSGGKRIYKSFDGGVTWDSVFIPSADAFNMDWVDLNNGIVVGTAGYTAKTTDGGLTWTERNTGTSTLTGISMASKDTAFTSCDRNVFGAVLRLYDNNPTVTTVNLTVGIEAFWNGARQIRDTVKCHLRSSTAPYNEIEVTSAVLDNYGYGSFNFTSPTSGSYYIEVTHRNSLETWSALPVNLNIGGDVDYNFLTSSSKAYGNNTVHVFGRYCDFSGDVNQDGFINLADIVATFNASASFTIGYVPTDVNGDNIVDLTDITYVFNNSSAFVAKVTP